ncbi:MAG: hypothetical protein E7Z90_05520 [Cyanobacteria bacterium SIG29]|nr:hypothetical protein [Cyanobacteria bacterium SIG29]
MKKFLFLILILFCISPISIAQDQKEIQFIYINGSNNNDKKMKNWFYKGMNKMHPKMRKQFLESEFISEKLLENNKYTISAEPEAYFWGDKSIEGLELLNSDLSITEMFSPRLAQRVRTFFAHCLHDAIWVSHYRNMRPVISDLHKQIMENHNKGKSVILFGYSAGSFVTYEYMFNKFANIDVEKYFDNTNTSNEFKTYVKANKKKDTCIDALIDSKLAVFSAEGVLIPNNNLEKAKENYDKLDEYTCLSCMPENSVKGVVNFASPLILFYSDISNPRYSLTYHNKLLYKYLLENNIFWLTVNYADDPFGFPTTKNISFVDLQDKIKLDIKPNKGFLYNKSNVKSRRTFLGAHTSYWDTANKFSKAVVKAYEDGYELYNSNDL